MIQGLNPTILLQCPCGVHEKVNLTGSESDGQEFDECFTKNVMMHGINVDRIGKLLTGLNMSGTNLAKTKVGIDLRQKRMTRIRNDAQTEIIQMKSELESEMLDNVLSVEGDKIFSFDAAYSNRSNSAQACWGSMFSKLDGKSVCVGSCVVKRKGDITDEAAKKGPGIICNLIPKKLEAYALELLVKMIADRTKEQFYLCSV